MWNNIIDQFNRLPPFVYNLLLAVAAVIIGLIFKGLAKLIMKFYKKPESGFSFFSSTILRLSKPVSWFLPILVLNLALPLMILTSKEFAVLNKIIGVMLIISFAYVLVAVVKIFEDFVYHFYDLNKADNLRERKIRTQLQFLRKVIISIIVVFALGAILISFSSLRRIGTGLLTGVGISGIIIGFAAQKSLGNLLAGLQIAFTQPFRIDDVLVVDGEFGRVEEITLTYVVLHIWDERRLILPITYLIDKPFQNWTRSSSNIMGTVFLYLDYTAPFDDIRKEFHRLVDTSSLWDRRAAGLAVTDSTEQTVQIRMVISALNASQAFDLKTFVRENMITFIQQNYPDSLPKTRALFDGKEAESKAEV